MSTPEKRMQERMKADGEEILTDEQVANLPPFIRAMRRHLAQMQEAIEDKSTSHEAHGRLHAFSALLVAGMFAATVTRLKTREATQEALDRIDDLMDGKKLEAAQLRTIPE